MLFSRLAISLIFAGAVAVGTAVGTGINLLTERYTFDDDGFNAFGFDRDGYDRRGYDRDGFDRIGFDVRGYDRRGYDRDGYNVAGRDRSRLTRADYADRIAEAERLSADSLEQLRAGDPDAAHETIRRGLAAGVKVVIAHKLRESYAADALERDLVVCRTYRLMDEEFLDRLADAQSSPTAGADVNDRYSAAASARETLEELTTIARLMTGTPEMLADAEHLEEDVDA